MTRLAPPLVLAVCAAVPLLATASHAEPAESAAHAVSVATGSTARAVFVATGSPARAVFVATGSDAEPVSLAGPQSDAALAAIVAHAEGDTAASTHPVLRWNAPPVSGPRYVLSGHVRYEGVDGTGYLEMWSHFGDRGSYFSRTLAEGGPLARLSGDSAGRSFSLPFDTGESGLVPERVELNIVLPGRGRVVVSELRWSGAADAGAPPSAAGGPTLGAFAAGLGTALGMLGALVGVLGGRGRARGAVMGALGLVVAIASVATGAAFWGLVGGRPVRELVPLAGVGAVGFLLVACGLPVLRKRYAEAELRKMRALDLDTRPLVPRS